MGPSKRPAEDHDDNGDKAPPKKRPGQGADEAQVKRAKKPAAELVVNLRCSRCNKRFSRPWTLKRHKTKLRRCDKRSVKARLLISKGKAHERKRLWRSKKELADQEAEMDELLALAVDMAFPSDADADSDDSVSHSDL